MKKISLEPIGIIHSPFKKAEGTPIQPGAAKGVEGTVEVFEQYSPGLKDLEGFSHICLLFHFHLIKKKSLLVRPFLDDTLRGVFATRAPSRPNSIGLSIVRLQKIESNILFIRDIDIIDGTPLIDIKPYVPAFDAPEALSIGWLEGKIDALDGTFDDARFTPKIIK